MSYAVTRRSYGVSFGEWADTHNILGAALLVCFFQERVLKYDVSSTVLSMLLGQTRLPLPLARYLNIRVWAAWKCLLISPSNAVERNGLRYLNPLLIRGLRTLA